MCERDYYKMTVVFGENIKVELYGTSHGPCVGVKIEGLPAGRSIDTARLQSFLDRRAPGRNAWSTARKEADRPEFVSGVSRSDSSLITTGEPLIAQIRNTNIRPQDYENAAVVPRPGHADYPAFVKYGKIESGGGQFSARLTAALCIAGGIFMQWLEEAGVSIAAHIRSIGDIEDKAFDPVRGTDGSEPVREDFPVIDLQAGEAMKSLIAEVKASGDSIGGSIECMICGLPPGEGEPLFGSIEGRICQAVFAVPAVKGIEFGAGFGAARMKGSENNDPFIVLREETAMAECDATEGRIRTRTNHHGGILGGLSSGMPIVFRVAMKPTPSIAIKQQSVDLMTMMQTPLCIKGRHDPCIVPRAVPCIEAAAAIAAADLYF